MYVMIQANPHDQKQPKVVSRKRVRTYSESARFSVNENGLLTVRQNGQKAQMKVSAGDLIHVGHATGALQLTKVAPPSNKIDFLPWLFGFKRSERYYDWERFNQAIQAKCRNRGVDHLITTRGNGAFEYATYVDPETGYDVRLGMYVDRSVQIDKEFVLAALDTCNTLTISYPRYFIERVLRQMFEFDVSDVMAFDTINSFCHWFRWK